MTTSATTAAQTEIPIKLRCAICSELAVNAFRLPCCDQAICESCQSTLPSSCPVCDHNPVSAEDCKPNKSLRTTIKVFLRTEEKKREAIRLKELKNSPPATPVDNVPTPVEAPTTTEAAPAAAQTEEPLSVVDQAVETPAQPENTEQFLETQQDIPQPSIEEIAPGQEPTQEGDANQAEDATNGEEPTEKDINDQPATGLDISQTPGFNAGFGFDPSAAGGFPGMGAGGDFNQMQQMQMMMAMQNGMAPNAFGAFPMMGMPGMGMDPMAMQSMMLNGGFGGAGMTMNGMNLGVGMGGFDGGNSGFSNSWGQQSWNVGQENFNHANATGMGHGDYGSNSGYNPQSTGYNQGNYGRGHNDYQQNNYGWRGRGRGRGYGRGGYAYGSNDSYPQQQYASGQQPKGPISETGSIPTGPKADAAANSADVDEFGREIRHTSETKDVAQSEAKDVPTPSPPSAPAAEDHKVAANDEAKETPVHAEEFTPQPIQTLDEAQAGSYAVTNGYHNGASSRGGFSHGRGSFGTMHPPIVKPVDVPINAPTGPKAMREGLPNTGLSSLRGRGFSITGRATSSGRINGSTSVAPETASEEIKERDRSRSPSRDRSRSRDRKRSRSRERHHRRHRHRSTSLSEDEKETERRRQRRKERRRRHEEEADERDETGEKVAEDNKDDHIDEERSRSASPSESKRSSHRSRRDRDKYRERDRDDKRDRDEKYRDRDDEKDYKSSHKHRSSHRYRDDRSRSRDRDREHRHRHSRRGSEEPESKPDKSVPPTPIEAEEPTRRPSAISNGAHGIEIKGVSSRHKNTMDEVIIPTGPRSERKGSTSKEKPSRHHEEDRHRSSRHRDSDREKEKERERPTTKEKERSRPAPATIAPPVQDPHTIEREARNRERLLKEAQRIAGLAGMAGGRKRSRDDGNEGGSRNGRKKRGRGGDESDEARIARLEAERESARWG